MESVDPSPPAPPLYPVASASSSVSGVHLIFPSPLPPSPPSFALEPPVPISTSSLPPPSPPSDLQPPVFPPLPPPSIPHHECRPEHLRQVEAQLKLARRQLLHTKHLIAYFVHLYRLYGGTCTNSGLCLKRPPPNMSPPTMSSLQEAVKAEDVGPCQSPATSTTPSTPPGLTAASTPSLSGAATPEPDFNDSSGNELAPPADTTPRQYRRMPRTGRELHKSPSPLSSEEAMDYQIEAARCPKVKGVTFNADNLAWRASICLSSKKETGLLGNRKFQSFSIRAYGFWGARELAIKWRNSMETGNYEELVSLESGEKKTNTISTACSEEDGIRPNFPVACPPSPPDPEIAPGYLSPQGTPSAYPHFVKDSICSSRRRRGQYKLHLPTEEHVSQSLPLDHLMMLSLPIGSNSLQTAPQVSSHMTEPVSQQQPINMTEQVTTQMNQEEDGPPPQMHQQMKVERPVQVFPQQNDQMGWDQTEEHTQGVKPKTPEGIMSLATALLQPANTSLVQTADGVEPGSLTTSSATSSVTVMSNESLKCEDMCLIKPPPMRVAKRRREEYEAYYDSELKKLDCISGINFERKQQAWIASVGCARRRRRKQFAAGTYGFHEARKLAILWQQETREAMKHSSHRSQDPAEKEDYEDDEYYDDANEKKCYPAAGGSGEEGSRVRWLTDILSVP
eukprot:GHVQ01033055.1.p1 GENE.GHVQ01033055.1~~GHVQ01033055.1.p1  ORF type:complete len:678 (-),score=127.88 GHVQ01033055.1:1388-3421(-)